MAGQTHTSLEHEPAAKPRAGVLRLAVVFGVAALALVGVFNFAQWRADTVSLNRYCDDPAGHVARIGEILAKPALSEDESRRPYIVAAKLLYLVPQKQGESDTDYLSRLTFRIETTCR